MDLPVFLTPEMVFELRKRFGTPLFVYDRGTLEQSARDALAFPNAHGLTVRYAMKALPTAAVLRVFDAAGLHLDASSGYEAERAMRAGIAPNKIQITSQELPPNLKELTGRGCLFNACSLHQLATYGRLFPGAPVSVRINPGLGSGHSNRTNVGGPSSSFGIWHEHLDRVLETAAACCLALVGMHTHIGSGTDPEVWVHCAGLALDIAARLPAVTRLSLGGGFKPARMPYEQTASLQDIGARLLPAFAAFAQRHGRALHLEIEPGAWLTANAGALIASVIDVADTGPQGHRFIKTDTGMTEILRPSMYGAQHPIAVVPASPRGEEACDCLVAGHCCESGDLLSPEPGNPEGLGPRALTCPQIGDAVVIGGAGAYCASMASKNYNSFPECPEVLLASDGVPRLVRSRQTLEQMVQNEIMEGE